LERVKKFFIIKLGIIVFLIIAGANTYMVKYNELENEYNQLKVDFEAIARTQYEEILQIDPTYSSLLERRLKRHGITNYKWFDKHLLPPLNGERVIVSSEYGNRMLKGYWHFHYGVDLIPLNDLSVFSSTTGRVYDRFEDRVFGLVLQIECEDYIITYAHLEKAFFYRGDIVSIGDIIGFVGMTGFTTGLHLHYSIQEKTPRGNFSINPFRNSTYGNMVNVTRHKDRF
jgi:murein DD-endopeptidase MepM/ murein hydrolase activator NlpD